MTSGDRQEEKSHCRCTKQRMPLHQTIPQHRYDTDFISAFISKNAFPIPKQCKCSSHCGVTGIKNEMFMLFARLPYFSFGNNSNTVPLGNHGTIVLENIFSSVHFSLCPLLPLLAKSPSLLTWIITVTS